MDTSISAFRTKAGESESLALIVDDESTNRLLLRALLRKHHYAVIEAVNGRDAIEMNAKESPDIIFMDIMMPIMDGYTACKAIKRHNGDRFVPVVFLTALNDEDALAKCIESGGDDFLVKPFSNTLLSSKLKVHERNQFLHRELRALYDHLRHDEEIAERVFSNAVLKNNIDSEQVRTFIKPASLFSGDVFLSAYTPSNDLHVLLGDFTGHGLSAAIGALPVSEVFHSMTRKGFSLADILFTINEKLKNLLPTEMFMAAIIVRVDTKNRMVSYYNCGMPPVIFKSLETESAPETVPSTGFPLGIVKGTDFSGLIQHKTFNDDLRIILATDGVSEARNEAGKHFGDEHLMEVINEFAAKDDFIEVMANELNTYCGRSEQDDDISLIQIDCIPTLDVETLHYAKSLDASQQEQLKTTETADGVTFTISLYGDRMRSIDPIPAIIHQIKELSGIHEHLEALFTILTELYVNALDHGVLGLDSSLKDSPDGFYQYYAERESRLNQLDSGYIHISFHIHSNIQPETISIRIEDSGEGFDIANTLEEIHNGEGLCGRGILLVGELCRRVQYHPPGNQVEVEYLLTD